jgi:competence protein ComEC
MKLPAVAMAAAFAGGIVIGLQRSVAAHASSRELVVGFFIGALAALGGGYFLVRADKLWAASAAALACWVLLGVVGACLGQQPRPGNHVTSLLANGRLTLRTPLRWHGVLREEPTRLPWGYGYELSLSGVDYEGAFLPLQGGLRFSYAPPQSADRLSSRGGAGEQLPSMEAETKKFVSPEVHAGDEISVTTEARLPQMFRDEGAFDRRAFLAGQGVDLVGTLRAEELLERVSVARPSLSGLVSRARGRLRDEVDELFGARPDVARVLRAMLLGDRNFVERAESVDFQRTGVFHVLVVAGLHVAAIGAVLFWIGRRLRLPTGATTAMMILSLVCYVAIVEQRPSVLRAALMVAMVAIGRLWFRRLDLLNSAAMAAVILLVAKPLLVLDGSFQLTFLAVGCVAGIAGPLLDKWSEPYRGALRELQNVARDGAQTPKAAQLRIDLRSAIRWVSIRLPRRMAFAADPAIVCALRIAFRVFEMAVITVVLQIGMLPMMTRDFHRVTLSGPLANMATVPLLGLMVPLGFLTIFTGTIFPGLARWLAAPLSWLTVALLHIVKYFAGLVHWNYPIPGCPPFLVLVFFVAGIVVAAVLRLEMRWRTSLAMAGSAILLGAAVVMATFPFAAQWHRGEMEVTVLDVGQGDSLFVVSPGGKTMLIDGGGASGGFPRAPQHWGIDPGQEAVSPYLWSRGFKRIDYVAVTHAHQDHVGGLTAVLENFHVGMLMVGREVAGPALAKLEELARANGAAVLHERRGERFAWDGAEGEVLWPDSGNNNVAEAPKNNDSMVMRWGFGERAFMLPGDAEKQAEREILAETAAESLRADVLKVGHHGSKNSTTEEFLAAVHPRVAVISAGENNRYGHPSPELLERLERARVRVLRTDRDGAVHILTDGRRLEISCFVACPETVAEPELVRTQAPENQQEGEKK